MKALQDRPERGRCPHPGEQPPYRPVPQQRHVIDRVGAGDHPGDQGRDLQVRVDPNGLAQLDLVGDQALQTGPFSQLQDRRQTSARHQIRVVKHGRDVVTDSQLAGAFVFAVN